MRRFRQFDAHATIDSGFKIPDSALSCQPKRWIDSVLPAVEKLGLGGILKTMFDKEHLVKLANMRMPFGKYQGRVLIDLPEEYLLWFAKQGFPRGELGLLLQLALELKIEGLDAMVRPLKQPQADKP